MTGWTLYVKQLPLLLVCIPFCGILTIALVRLIGREHLRRTFLLNGVLSFGCALLMVFQFQSGAERTSLSRAESFQSVSIISFPELSADFRIGIDGCSLLLILLVSALPLLVCGVWTEPNAENRAAGPATVADMTCGQAALVLLFQILLLIFLTSLDRRVQLVTMLLSTCVLFIELSISLPSARRKLLSRCQRQILLSDFLIAGGLLATLTPLVRTAGVGNHPDFLFDLIRLLDAIELLRDEDLSQYVRLMETVIPAMVVLLVGCSIRFGVFPFSAPARTMWEQTAPWQRLLIWAHGPLLGMALLLRELQVFPLAAYQVIGVLKYVWLAGLFVSALIIQMSQGSRREAASLVLFATLLLLSAGGSNSVSLAGAFLLLFAFGLRLSASTNGPGLSRTERYVRGAARFLTGCGIVCTLIGAWQGLGPGSRGLGYSLWMGLILGISAQRVSRRQRQNEVSAIPKSRHPSTTDHSERPVWEIPSPPAAEPAESHWQSSMRSLGLILAVCLLLMIPNFLWQRIRWDLQSMEFPRPEFSLTARERDP